MNAPATNIVEYTVSDLAFALRRTIEADYELVRVRGEVSGFKGVHGSGHCYFRLKDDRACLEAVIWKTTLQRMRFKPQDGLEMVATGKLTTYPGKSTYQIIIERLEPAGAGALMALLEERRRKLAAEGLFDPAHKKRLPYLPRVIGIVTSPTGAVIRDILHRLRDRFPRRVLVWPVRVQGEGAADEVAAAVRGFNALGPGSAAPRPDLLIVARGGGSVEDLWAFNEEIAVRAVAASRIPIIAAVGHETDWTLIDHAADLRAPTPTGAAEMAVPVRAELVAAVRELASRHDLGQRRAFEFRRRDYAALCRALPSLDDILSLRRQRLDEIAGRLGRSLGAEVGQKRERLRGAGARLSPAILARADAQRRQRLASDVMRLWASEAALLRQAQRDLQGTASRLSPAILARADAQRRERLGSTDSRLAAALAGSLRHARRDFLRTGERFSVAGVDRIVRAHGERYAHVCRLFQTLRDTASPEAILAKGFALVFDASGTTIRTPGQVASGDALTVRLATGELGVTVTDKNSRPRRLSRRKAAPAVGQGSLF